MVKVELPIKFETDVKMPDLTTGDPVEIWDAFFSQHRPAPRLVSGWVMNLHSQKKYKEVIACLQAALIHGQAQPWMYEVLALSMEIENYPKESVERVVLSLSDFGQADYGTMMYSGAYLTRFGRKSAALTMYQQASRILPERPEPYVLGLKLAKESGQPQEVKWAATGILLNYWGTDFAKKQRDAEDALLEQMRLAERQGNPALAADLRSALVDARSRDLTLRLDWNGEADLDLKVEEPGGFVCSFESPETPGGGLYLHDGVGPDSKNSYELYVCPRGVAGPYRVTVKNALGTLVGNRATLTVTTREGLPDQDRFVRTLVLDGDDVGLTIDLVRGRRTQLRSVTELAQKPVLDEGALGRTGGARLATSRGPQAEKAMRDFLESREDGARRAGAVGYAPVIQVIPEGSSLSAQAVVSPDRRYVRIGLQPVFSEITDVFTFSFLNGNGGQTQQQQPQQPAAGR